MTDLNEYWRFAWVQKKQIHSTVLGYRRARVFLSKIAEEVATVVAPYGADNPNYPKALAFPAREKLNLPLTVPTEVDGELALLDCMNADDRMETIAYWAYKALEPVTYIS